MDLSLWGQALSRIQSELPSQAYETWFQPTRAVESSEGALTVEVPNPFFRDWLTSHYSELIDRTLFALAGSKVRVDYAISALPSATEPGHPPFGGSATQEAGEANRAVSGPSAGIGHWVPPNVVPGARQGEGPPAIHARKAPWETTARAPAPDIVLNTRYTFSEFIVGPSNRFAHAAALAVSESPAKVYNPFFIHGGVGLGKTHLMQAIGHRIRERFPSARCIYLSSERFTNQLITAIQNRSMAAFRERFRNADVLMVDDIHFIGGKESTQEVFFHTFNALYDAHKQIIVSSDRSPKELRGVEERLVSRFEWGLVTDVQPPDLETRVAILRKKAESQGTAVPDDVTLFIAERVTSNIRELEGALNRVIAYSVLTSREISLAMAQEILKGMVAETARNVTVEKIQRAVADYFNLSVSDLKGKRRTKAVSLPRQIAMALTRELTEFSLPAIGESFGGRDHATVIYACQKITEERQKGGKVQEVLSVILAELQK